MPHTVTSRIEDEPRLSLSPSFVSLFPNFMNMSYSSLVDSQSLMEHFTFIQLQMASI